MDSNHDEIFLIQWGRGACVDPRDENPSKKPRVLDIYRRLGERVRRERERLGWTQEELAERAGLHPAYVGQIERAQKKVSLATVDRLVEALGVSTSSLLDPAQHPDRRSSWESKIGGLLRDRSPSEKEILYSTLRQLARSIRKNRSPREI